MADALWWQSGVVYQVYPRSFMDANGDGVGDLNGIISKLDYLEWLGVDAIWLSPFYPSPMADFGYDIANYTDVDPVFGTLDDFDLLVIEAARRNIKIIVDLVPNHTSDEHPWFKESRSSRDNPKRDWYVWRDPKPDGSPPNNWISNFGGGAWQFDETTGQYYLHLFDIKQPDLNWRNPEVRQAIYEVMRFWLNRGVGGFRIDVINLLMKDKDLRDNPLNPDWKPGDPWHRQQLKIHSENQPEIKEILQEMRRVGDEYEERVLIGELYLPFPQLVNFYGENLDGIHLPFNFDLIFGGDWTPQRVKASADLYESVLPPGAWPNWVLGNHDNPRIATRIGPAQARVAQMFLLTIRGTPTLYYGDELGMLDVIVPPELAHDPQGKGSPGHGRDNERTPMQWDDSPNAGFSPVTPWLPVSDDFKQVNVEVERQQPDSMLALTYGLLQLRRSEEALHSGNYLPLDTGSLNSIGYMREYENHLFLIVLNFSGHDETIALPNLGSGAGQIRLSTHLDVAGMVKLDQLHLRANEGLVIEL